MGSLLNDPKPRQNHRLYLEILRRMTPAERLAKAIELTRSAKWRSTQGMLRRHPGMTEAQARWKLFELVHGPVRGCRGPG